MQKNTYCIHLYCQVCLDFVDLTTESTVTTLRTALREAAGTTPVSAVPMRLLILPIQLLRYKNNSDYEAL